MAKRTNTVKQEWLSYRHDVVPPLAGPTQLRETEQAFYAGAAAMFSMMVSVTEGVGEDAEITDKETKPLFAIQEELEAWFKAKGFHNVLNKFES